MFGHLDVVKLLLRHGADPTVKNHEGLAAYEFSLRYNFPQITEYLRTYRAGKEEQTPSPHLPAKVSMNGGAHSNGSAISHNNYAASPSSPSISSTSSSVVMPTTTVFSVTIPTNTPTMTGSKKVVKLQTTV